MLKFAAGALGLQFHPGAVNRLLEVLSSIVLCDQPASTTLETFTLVGSALAREQRHRRPQSPPLNPPWTPSRRATQGQIGPGGRRDASCCPLACSTRPPRGRRRSSTAGGPGCRPGAVAAWTTSTRIAAAAVAATGRGGGRRRGGRGVRWRRQRTSGACCPSRTPSRSSPGVCCVLLSYHRRRC